MGKIKQNFALNAKVRFVECKELSGETGTILGLLGDPDPIVNYYLVLLDDPLPNRLGIVMSEACLELI
jgi:hypothetical protein